MQGIDRVKSSHKLGTARAHWGPALSELQRPSPGEASERKAWDLHLRTEAGRCVPAPRATQHVWGSLEDRPYLASPRLPELHAEFISCLSTPVKALTEWLPKDKDQGWFWIWPDARQELICRDASTCPSPHWVLPVVCLFVTHIGLHFVDCFSPPCHRCS